MPLVLPLAVFEGEALLRHLRHRRRRHRVQEDTKIQYSILSVCARSENLTIYSSCRNKLEPVCCTVMMLLVEQRISTRRSLILKTKIPTCSNLIVNEIMHMNLMIHVFTSLYIYETTHESLSLSLTDFSSHYNLFEMNAGK